MTTALSSSNATIALSDDMLDDVAGGGSGWRTALGVGGIAIGTAGVVVGGLLCCTGSGFAAGSRLVASGSQSIVLGIETLEGK